MYTESEARQLVCDAGRTLVSRKLIARTWGNISARISEDEFVITPSGISYESLTPEDMVVVRIRDLSYEGDLMPSSEKGVHAAAYRLRRDTDFVVHTHQFYASVIAAECRDTKFAPCAEYALPGTRKLRRNVGKAIRSNPGSRVFLMARHGALILGRDPEDAFALADKLEEDSRRLFMSRVPDVDTYKHGKPDTDRFRVRTAKYMNIVRDPYVLECCCGTSRQKAYLDDFAQIAGPDIARVPNRMMKIRRALRKRSAVLIKGVGAMCTGSTLEDAEAVAMIVSKNCACECYVRREKPLARADAMLMRRVYLTKYSKRNR